MIELSGLSRRVIAVVIGHTSSTIVRKLVRVDARISETR